ncbi:MAG: hypothetical protein WCS77_00125 [Elusimicrobiaceae bacterium]|jgi:hypothetical protein
MEHLKEWIIGGALTGAVALFSPVVRRKLSAALGGLAQRGYAWLFATMPLSLDYSLMPADRQDEARACVKDIVQNMVRLEEILIPDGGLGPEKKKRVMDKLAAFGLPEAIVGLAGDLIDDAVKTMNAEAEAALKKYAPPGGDTPA